METSPTVAKLATALAAFQADVPAVTKDSKNPYFKSNYASLENVISTITPHLKKHGLSFSQLPDAHALTTIVMHASGEWLKASADLFLAKQDPQGQGSAITYMRRYALCGALGLATEEDDDGNAASRPKPHFVQRVVPPADDEAGGSTVRRESEAAQDEVAEMQKEGIKDILKQLKKPVSKKAVKDLTGLDMEPENYDAIYKALRKALEKTDPLETIEA